MIAITDRVASILAKDEGLIEVFVAASPKFQMLRNKAARKTMARLVTIEQAAKIAGIDAAELAHRLNAAMGSSEAPPAPAAAAAPQSAAAPAPPGLLETPPELLVDLDVREDLRQGKEPFHQIMQASLALKPGQVLRLYAIFEPAPLYAVLAKQRLNHYTERFSDDDWRVWFYRDDAISPVANGAADPIEHADDVIVLDVRGLEPPEPMVQTLEALAALPRGKTLMQINVRVPQFLIPKLAERGFTYEVREQSPDLVRIFIRHQ